MKTIFLLVFKKEIIAKNPDYNYNFKRLVEYNFFKQRKVDKPPYNYLLSEKIKLSS